MGPIKPTNPTMGSVGQREALSTPVSLPVIKLSWNSKKLRENVHIANPRVKSSTQTELNLGDRCSSILLALKQSPSFKRFVEKTSVQRESGYLRSGRIGLLVGGGTTDT